MRFATNQWLCKIRLRHVQQGKLTAAVVSGDVRGTTPVLAQLARLLRPFSLNLKP